MGNKYAVGHLTALLTISIWGTTFISTKILLIDFTPVEILFFRFIMGFAALIIVYPRRMDVKEGKHELYFAIAGICGVTMYYLLENIALTYTMASNVGVISALAPFFTAMIAYFFLREEKLRLHFFLGFAVAMAGVYLITFSGASNLQINPIGDLLAVAATIVWAVYSVLMRKISRFGYNTLQTTRKIFFYGILFMIPSLFLFEFQLDLTRFAEPINLFNIIFLGLGASALCFVTWNFAVKVLGPIKTSVYIYLVPVITVIASAIILREKITVLAAIGTVLALTGLLLSEGRLSFKKKRQKEDSYHVS